MRAAFGLGDCGAGRLQYAVGSARVRFIENARNPFAFARVGIEVFRFNVDFAAEGIIFNVGAPGAGAVRSPFYQK